MLKCSARALSRRSAERASPSQALARRGLASGNNNTLLQYSSNVTRGLGRLTDGIIAKGSGSYVEFTDGRRMLDFTCGIGVANLGHCHPKISSAAAEQCMNLVHGQCSIAFHGPYLQLIEKLIPMMPDRSLDSFFFWNSGTEAIEAALKMARLMTGRPNIIAMQGGYHGRTYGAMAVTRSKTIYSEGQGPLMPSVFVTPYPYWHQLNVPASTSSAELAQKALYQLELLLQQQTAGKDTAAILIEPLLGEGGYVPAPPEYLQGLREICDKHGILLIIDEVQSGFARTGKNFFIEHSGVRPDILTIAKGIANGFPLSGVVTRKELSDKLKPGSMGGTYAGNAVSCAAGVAVADVLEEEKIIDNVNARSEELFSALHALKQDSTLGPHILDVRGQGLMVAVEFASPVAPVHDPFRKVDSPKNLAARVARRCIDKGMLLLTTSVYEVVRFIPPLNITKEDMAKGCTIFKESLEEIVREG